MTTFTVDHANNMLPLVQRIVGDIVEHTKSWRSLTHQFESSSMLSPGPNAELDSLKRQIGEVVRELERFRAELEELGVELKDYDIGLVDFPGELEGREVYLCWRFGEPEVGHWHDRDVGYAGPRPLTPQTTT